MGKSLWRSRFVMKDLLRDGIDLYHGLSGELPIGIKKAGIKTVVTIHDLIFMRHPEFYNPLDAWIYARKFYRTCHEADRIIAISGYAANDFATQWQQQKTGSQAKLHYFRHNVLHHTTATVQHAAANTAWLTIENPAALQAWLQI